MRWKRHEAWEIDPSEADWNLTDADVRGSSQGFDINPVGMPPPLVVILPDQHAELWYEDGSVMVGHPDPTQVMLSEILERVRRLEGERNQNAARELLDRIQKLTHKEDENE